MHTVHMRHLTRTVQKLTITEWLRIIRQVPILTTAILNRTWPNIKTIKTRIIRTMARIAIDPNDIPRDIVAPIPEDPLEIDQDSEIQGHGYVLSANIYINQPGSTNSSYCFMQL